MNETNLTPTVHRHRTRTCGAATLALLGAALFAGTAMADPPKQAGDAARATAPAESTSLEGTVNVNTATAEELMRLPGVGPSRAEAVIATRKQKPFEKVEDIMRVKGIGRATFRKLRAHLAVTGTTTLKAPGTAKPAKPTKVAAKQ